MLPSVTFVVDAGCVVIVITGGSFAELGHEKTANPAAIKTKKNLSIFCMTFILYVPYDKYYHQMKIVTNAP